MVDRALESYLVDYDDVSLENWYVVRDIFSSDEIDALLHQSKQLNPKEATTIGDADDYRKSTIKWIPKFKSDEYGWIYKRLLHWVDIANEENWKFDIIGCKDDTQYTEYEMGGKYDWHMDILGESINHRKISLSVNLNSDFTGGKFQFKFGRGITDIFLEKGDAVIFPSFFMHRVTPVTNGVRKSLVQWISGKPFK